MRESEIIVADFLRISSLPIYQRTACARTVSTLLPLESSPGCPVKPRQHVSPNPTLHLRKFSTELMALTKEYQDKTYPIQGKLTTTMHPANLERAGNPRSRSPLSLAFSIQCDQQTQNRKEQSKLRQPWWHGAHDRRLYPCLVSGC